MKMKKIIASAVGLMLAGGIATTASAAVENQFGGYWRTRFVSEDENMVGNTVIGNREYVDTRTRLFYTAKFSDDFKFVNQFEFNTGWGDKNGGDIAADGKGNWRIKRSYADFNMGPVNATVGIQNAVIGRGFVFGDDFAGVIVTPKFGNVSIPLVWINATNEEQYAWDGTAAERVPDFNQNIFAALAVVKINDATKVVPYVVYHPITDSEVIEDSDNFYVGMDADVKFGSVSVWGTGIYNGGDIAGLDTNAFLAAAGADAGIVHGQAFFATGDDNPNDGDNDGFITAPGRIPTAAAPNFRLAPSQGASYYWAEIMGYGVFDQTLSPGSPGDDITNIWAANAGVTIKPMDKLKIDADVWYAALVEDNAAGETELGVEFDVKLTYIIFENMTAEAIFAYLIAGEASGDEDIIEGGLQLSLKF
jgi:hypothetical protein